MKTKTALMLMLAMMAPPVMRAGDLYVFAGKDGVVATAPRALPALGVALDSRKPVLGLHGASDLERAACGWFRVIPSGAVLASNEVITARTYKVDAKTGTALEEVTIVQREPRVALTLRQRLERILDSMEAKLTEEEKVLFILRTLADVEEAREAK